MKPGLNIARIRVATTYLAETLGLPEGSLIVSAHTADPGVVELHVVHEDLPMVADGEEILEATVVFQRVEAHYVLGDSGEDT